MRPSSRTSSCPALTPLVHFAGEGLCPWLRVAPGSFSSRHLPRFLPEPFTAPCDAVVMRPGGTIIAQPRDRRVDEHRGWRTGSTHRGAWQGRMRGKADLTTPFSPLCSNCFF